MRRLKFFSVFLYLLNCISLKNIDSVQLETFVNKNEDVYIYFLYEEKEVFIDNHRREEIKRSSLLDFKKKSMQKDISIVMEESNLFLKSIMLEHRATKENNKNPFVIITLQKKSIKDFNNLLMNLVSALSIGIYPASSKNKLFYEFEIIKKQSKICNSQYELDFNSYFTWYLIPFWPFYSEQRLEKKFLIESTKKSLIYCSKDL